MQIMLLSLRPKLVSVYDFSKALSLLSRFELHICRAKLYSSYFHLGTRLLNLTFFNNSSITQSARRKNTLKTSSIRVNSNFSEVLTCNISNNTDLHQQNKRLPRSAGDHNNAIIPKGG